MYHSMCYNSLPEPLSIYSRMVFGEIPPNAVSSKASLAGAMVNGVARNV